jgi:hypothetical protein
MPRLPTTLLQRCLQIVTLVCLLAGLATSVRAQGVPLDDEQLSEVWGQALLTLENSSLNGLEFTRLTLGADVQLNANFSKVRLGEYSNSVRNGTGADIDIGALRFGRSDGTDAQRLVSITDPYFEFVYRPAVDGPGREVIGMRLGFKGIQGDIGIAMNTVSGSLRIDAGSAGIVDSRNDTLGGKRWDGTSCASGSSCPLALSQINMLSAGDANGASRDFFVAVLKQSVQFPSVNGVASDTALAGFWLNWRDRLAASRVNQTIPVNLPKAGGG